MALAPGARLGPYEIVATVPGDVSESYKATDTRQNRTVTLTPCPAHVSGDSGAKQRLERDIRTLAGLNHPHISAPYEVVHEAGADYLVSEHLDGETLAARLKRGPMPLEQVLIVAVAIADALDKAHRQGVIHRGLNPSNVVLTESGARLTDFGLARPSEPSNGPGPASLLSTRTTFVASASFPPAAAPYLAPEQLDGREPDARTDISAFGAVLYEMLTGRPAFEPTTPAMLLAAIQTVDPEPPSSLRPATPPALDYVVKRCLAKDPKQRLQTARDLVSHLQWVSEASTAVAVPATRAVRGLTRERWLWAATGAVVLLVLSLAPSAYRYFEAPPEPDEVRFIVSMPGTTLGTAGSSPAVVSPDGRWVASARVGGVGGLYLLERSSVTSKILLPGVNVFAPFWAPDSRSIAFFENGELKTSDVSGAPPQTLADAPFPVGGGTWSPEGVIVFASGGVLHRVPALGGQASQLTTLDSSLQETEHVAPFFLPDGRHYLYLAVTGDVSNSAVYVASIGSEERKRLFASESAAVYAAPGYLLFNRENAVLAQPFDADAIELAGEPIRLPDAAFRGGVSGLLTPQENRLANFSASQTGVYVYRSTATLGVGGNRPGGDGLVLTWLDRAGQGGERIGATGWYAGVDLAPDDKGFAVHLHEGQGGDNWFFDSGRLQRLTFDTAQENLMPVWSRDGTRIAFGSRRNGQWGVYVKAADGTGSEELIVESDLPKAPMGWSPDGERLVYWVGDPQTRGDLWMVPLQGDRTPVALVQTPANEMFGQVSPDGQWMAYQSDETGTPQIYIRPFPEGPGNRSQVSTEGANSLWPRWRGDGKELFFVVAPNMMAADIRVTGSSVQPGIPHPLFVLTGNPNALGSAHATAYHRYGVTTDGQRFLMPQPPTATAIGAGGLAGTLAAAADEQAGGAGGASDPDAITVVLNWTRALKQK
jgi:Tol biopolymer transport system component